MVNNCSMPDGNDYVSGYTQYGKKIINECRQTLQSLNIPIWQKKEDDKKQDESATTKSTNSDSYEKTLTEKKQISNLSHSANKAYANLVKAENNYISNGFSSPDDGFGESTTILNAAKLVETIESIDDAGKRHLDFLSEEAPESGNISGAVNGYYENGTDGNTTVFLGTLENRWQNKNKDIYTKFSANLGYQKDKNDDSQVGKNKIVGNISFDGRLDKKNFIYGAGAEYNSYTDNSRILDIHVAAKHKITGLGADLTRRTTITKDDTGEQSVVSNMKLKLDILSNKTDDQQSETSSQQNFSFESDGSALPPEAQELDTKAKNHLSDYLKPGKKRGSNLYFTYDENKCGVTYEYNYNFIEKQDKFLSVAPVIGLHDYTNPTQTDNNESFEITGGVITQFGKSFADGQTVSGTVTAMSDRMIKTGYRPSDMSYFLANASYNNPKAKFNLEVDAGKMKSGDISLEYVNLAAGKQMKNSSIDVSAGASRFNVSGSVKNLYNAMVSYKYNIPYKTKK